MFSVSWLLLDFPGMVELVLDFQARGALAVVLVGDDGTFKVKSLTRVIS